MLWVCIHTTMLDCTPVGSCDFTFVLHPSTFFPFYNMYVHYVPTMQAELADAEVQLSQPQPPPLPAPTTVSHDHLLKEVTTPPVDVSCDFISIPRLPSPVQPSMVETILAENHVSSYHLTSI